VTILKSYLSLYMLMSQRTAYGSGPLELGFQGYVPDSTNGFVQACSEAANIPIVNDLNVGNGVGIKHGTATLNSVLRRSSSYDGFYQQARHRTNLRVLHDAPVTGIAFSEPSANITSYNSTTALPRAIGVSYIEQSVGFVRQAKARKEVIISMGAFQSPQILMVSVSFISYSSQCVVNIIQGIGPQSELEKVGIEPLVINENVGRQ
jgi:choline dehydrogenase